MRLYETLMWPLLLKRSKKVMSLYWKWWVKDNKTNDPPIFITSMITSITEIELFKLISFLYIFLIQYIERQHRFVHKTFHSHHGERLIFTLPVLSSSVITNPQTTLNLFHSHPKTCSTVLQLNSRCIYVIALYRVLSKREKHTKVM